MRSAVYCEHANEAPIGNCHCDDDCYCKAHTCKQINTMCPAWDDGVHLYNEIVGGGHGRRKVCICGDSVNCDGRFR